MTAGRIRIGVVGAGIGGLTLALALRQRGLAADVYEQASELREIGAAVGLTANGTRELERLGCLDAIAAVSTEPSELIWRGWREGRRFAAFPIAQGGAYRTRFGAPFIGIHRADLQRVQSIQSMRRTKHTSDTGSFLSKKGTAWSSSISLTAIVPRKPLVPE